MPTTCLDFIVENIVQENIFHTQEEYSVLWSIRGSKWDLRPHFAAKPSYLTHAGIQANELDVTLGSYLCPSRVSMKKGEAGKLSALVAELLSKSFDLQSQHPIPGFPIWDHAHQRLTVGRLRNDNSSASCVLLATGTCAIAQVRHGGAHVRLETLTHRRETTW